MSAINAKSTSWMRFNKYLYPYRKSQSIVILLGLVTLPLGLLNPYLTKLVIDKAYGEKNLKLFFILAVIGGAVFIVNGVIGYFSGYLSMRINRHVHLDITKDFFNHLQQLPLSFFNDRSTGEHIYRINQDVRSVSEFVCSVIPKIIILFPRLLFIFAIVFYLNWKLALLAVLLVPVSYLHLYLFGKWLKEITGKTILKTQGIFKQLQEIFSHIHLIKAFGREKYELNRFETNLTKRVELELKNTKISNAGSISGSILNKALSGILALSGGYQVIKGTLSLGSLTAIMLYLTQLMGLLKSIGEFYQRVIVNSVELKRLGEILDIKPSICDTDSAIDYQIKKGKIEFKNVSFGYKEGSLVLNALNFVIAPGFKIALVGLSGCGKTTILSLILRLYEQSKGTILIDGIDIRKLKLNSLKSQISVALQEPFLWNDTIANNILYGAEEATYADVVNAARLAAADDFIVDFPNGYDTIIGEMACKISEGQKQRIALARALIKRPRILLLDEALSSVDSETEGRIIGHIKNEFQDSTVITVSHRLSAVRKMDLVYFFENSSTVEVGTHAALLERNPRYSHIFASQINEAIAHL